MENVVSKLKKNEIYTKVYKDGSKMIFQVDRKSKSVYGPNMVRVSRYYTDENNLYHSNSDVYVGSEGTSEDSIVREATIEEIKILIQ